MMNMNKAVGFYKHLPISNPDSFEDIMCQLPTIGDHDLLVKVEGVSVNPVDTFVRCSGRSTKMAHPKVIGWDAVGTVVKVGSECTLFKPNDQVWYAGDFKRSGSDSQYQSVDERIVGPTPQNLSLQEAAAIPLVGLTVYESLFEKLALSWDILKNKGKTILIINCAGGVGSMAIQLAKLAGLRVIATASNPDAIAWVNQLKADAVIDHHQDLVKQMHHLKIRDVDYILNLNNLDAHWNEIAEIIKPDGRVTATTENHKLIDLQKLTKKRVTFSWEWMYSKSYYQTADMATQNQILTELCQLFEMKKLMPITTKTYTPINAEHLKRAHRDVESGHMIGKVTLTGW